MQEAEQRMTKKSEMEQTARTNHPEGSERWRKWEEGILTLLARAVDILAHEAPDSDCARLGREAERERRKREI